MKLKRHYPTGLMAILLWADFAGAASPGSFFQTPQTTKDPGVAGQEQEPSGLVGLPGSPTPARQQGIRTPPAGAGQAGTGVPQQAPGRVTPGRTGGISPTPSPNLSARPPANRGGAGRDSRQPGVTLSFSNAPIEQVISSVMKELGYSYVIDPQVSGSINLYTQEEIPRDKLFAILEQLLKMNGQAIVRQQDFYVILPLGSSPKVPGAILVRPETSAAGQEAPAREGSAGEQPPQPPPESVPTGQSGEPPQSPEGAGGQAAASATPSGGPEQEGGAVVLRYEQDAEVQQLDQEEGVITYIIPLHYLPSSEMVKLIQAFVSDGAQVVDFQPANLIILTDYRAAIRQVLRLVHLLDTRYFDLNNLELVQVRYNKAGDVAEDLGKVFAPGDQAGGVRLVAIERLNSILVVTHAGEVLQEVKRWIEKLDAPTSGYNLKTYVYHVQNNVATHIAEILAQLFEDGSGLPSGPTAEGEEGQPRQRQQAGFVPEDRDTRPARFQQYGMMGGGGLGPQLSRPGMQGNVRAVVSGNVKIIVSEFDNSLIIQATEADYQFLLQTIKQLDVLPRQALIEARIYAVELRDDLSFGVAAFLQARESTGPPTTGSISSPGEGSSGGTLSVASRLAIGAERELSLLMNALRSKTNVEILEAPTLLVIDGTEAQINVGAEVPVTTASFGDPVLGGSTSSFVNSIQFRPTGTTLLLVPRISASGIVSMEVAVEVSSATGAALTPTINRNFVRTSLIARDNETVAIAGVISDQFDVSRDRVPILGDIPVLGALFGQTSRNKRRFELIFMITPRVIRTMKSSAELTVEFKQSLRNAYEFIERKEKEQRDLMEQRRGTPPGREN